MSDAATSRKRRAAASSNTLKKRRQKAYRERRKEAFEATLKMLEATPDDAPIEVIGKDWRPEPTAVPPAPAPARRAWRHRLHLMTALAYLAALRH